MKPEGPYLDESAGGPLRPRTLNRLERKIDYYFNTVTDEQLQKDLEEAGYRTYCQIPNFL